jgi:hypothetical protein
MKTLGKRLVGELLGETEYVAATLHPAFEVVMHSGETTVTLPGSVIAEGVAAQAAAGVLMWTEFDDFVVDGDTIATSGVMLILQLTERTLATTPVGLFLRFSGDRMTSGSGIHGDFRKCRLINAGDAVGRRPANSTRVFA